MVSVCLPSDALLQHLPSYLGLYYLGHGVSLHSCSSKVQPLLLTLDKGYLLTATLPDLQHGIAPLGPPMPAQPWLLGLGVSPPSPCPWPRAWGWSSRPWPLALGVGYHWVWCIGRGPHLQLRQEPQGTSDFRLRSQGPCRLGTGESGLVLG